MRQVGLWFPEPVIPQPSPSVERDVLFAGVREGPGQVPLSRKMGKLLPFLLPLGSQSTAFRLCLRAKKMLRENSRVF